MTADEFVKNVKNILDERGISYARAGRESGCGEEFVRSMERQKSAPSFVRVQKMAQYLGMTTSELLGEEKKPTPVSGDGPREEAHKLVDQLPLDKLAEAVRYMKFIKAPPDTK